ncbi:MAG: hypothetical protein L0Y72_07420 [Gemmataceae bacterium]|nr:hypothetical protein [Gemmataceae bacterium]MCI0738857.1 hypothetical protein [Gemmataceae bacterium]
MTVELFPEMAQNVFRPVLQRLEQDGTTRELAPDEIRELLSACGIGAAVLQNTLEALRGILRRGVEKEKLRVLQRQLLDVVDTALGRTYPEVRRIAGNARCANELGSELAVLDEYVQQARALAEELKNLQSWIERPRPKVEVSEWGAPKPRADYGEYEDSNDIETRLRAGGDF